MAAPVKTFRYINDKCNPPAVDMGKAFVFADPIPGMNDTEVKPFGWTEYGSAYRHQYMPDPKACRRPCVDPCRPKGTARKPPPRQFFNKPCTESRQGICNVCHMVNCGCRIPPPWDECKEKVVVYDPDSVRDLYVHHEMKNEHPFVVSQEQYERILCAAMVKTKEEKEKECLEQLRLAEMARDSCREMAEEMRLIDQNRMCDELTPQAREDMEEIICRSKSILKEDEPEVRTINSVILAAKVQAIREAQLAEKCLIKCEKAEEERRLLAVQDQDKEHAFVPDFVKEYEENEKKKVVLMSELQLQLNEKEACRFLEEERKKCDQERMKKVWEDAHVEEMKAKALEREKKQALGIELLNDQMQHLELLRQSKERERQLDQRMIEWQKQKALDDERLEKEKAAVKKQKALAVKQVQEKQKRSTDEKALRDELRSKRHIEEQERLWREQEREAVRKRQENMNNLKRDITQQIADKQNYYCEQAAFDKRANDRLYNIQDDRFEEERQKDEQRKLRAAQYRMQLREQIHDIRMKKICAKKNEFIEGIRLRQNAGQRENEIKCIMEEKLDELRQTNLPEKYMNYIRKAVEEELKPEWAKSMSKAK